MNELGQAAILNSLKQQCEEGATLAEAASNIREQHPNLSAIHLAQALAKTLPSISQQTSAPAGKALGDVTVDPLAGAIEIASALKAAGYSLNEIAPAIIAPGVYPGLTAFQLGTVLLSPSVFPSTTEAEMRTALQAASYSQADIDQAIAQLFPPPVQTGGVIHYQLQAGQPLPAVWVTKPNPQGPAVAAGDNLLHYSVSNLPAFNQWLFVSTSTALDTTQGCLVIFNVRANMIQGDEVKFTVTGEPILRFTNGGQTVKWQRWDNNFFDLAPSSIRADGKWHQIIIALTPGAVTLFEDGKRLFTWQRNVGNSINPRFDMQVLTPGASLSFDVGDIYAVPYTFATDNSTAWDYVFLKNTPPPQSQMQFTTDGGMQVLAYEDGFARVGGLPLRRINSWCFFKIPNNSPPASIFMYPLRVNVSQGYETKITLPGDNILRMLGDGQDSGWNSYDGDFHLLAPSGIKPGQTSFTIVTLIASGSLVTLLENGVFKYERSYSTAPQWNAGVAFQHYDTNNISADIGGLRSIPATKPSPIVGPIVDGAIITFQCTGNTANPANVWLDGRTADGSVGLAPNTSSPFTGAKWRAHAKGGNVFAFECLGVNHNPNYIWLDGRTADGSVGLAPNTSSPFTGTQWEVANQSNDTYWLKCLGVNVNPQHVWLSGQPVNGSVVLAPAATGGVSANANNHVFYQAHVADTGWLSEVSDGATAGTTEQSRQLEAIKIRIPDRHVTYQASVANIGWMAEVSDGAMAGTTGQARQMEAIRIRLDRGHVYYRAYVQNLGWMAEVSDGAVAGTTGRGLRIEALQIRFVDSSTGGNGTLWQASPTTL